MYRNYINLENFNHKLVVIFLEEGKMASPSLGSGKMILNTGSFIMVAAFLVTTWSF
jgi:hypothetical protein